MEQANNKYTIEELVADVTFQHYCTGRDPDALQYWTRYFKEHPELQQEREQARKLYLLLSGNHTDKQYKKHLELFKAKMESQLQPGQPVLKIKRAYSRIWLAAACVAILCFVSVVLFQNYFFSSKNEGRTFVSKAGEKKTIKLEDGSVVILNGASTLVLNDGFNSKNRRLKLDGEGYFEVKHSDKVPFVVETKSLLITDLGTKFNVKAFSGDRFTETALIEGLIEVAAVGKPDEKVLLRPNQKITFSNFPQPESAEKGTKLNILPLSKNTVANTIVETDWVQNRLTFSDENFSEIASKLERWYGVKIEFEKESMKAYKYVGTFENKSITQILDILKTSRDFNYRKEESRIVIY